MADNFDQPIENKTFYAKINVDTPQYTLQELPIIKDFTTFVSEDFAKNHTNEAIKKYVIQQNYNRIIEDIDLLTQEEMIRIKETLPHLIKPKNP